MQETKEAIEYHEEDTMTSVRSGIARADAAAPTVPTARIAGRSDHFNLGLVDIAEEVHKVVLVRKATDVTISEVDIIAEKLGKIVEGITSETLIDAVISEVGAIEAAKKAKVRARERNIFLALTMSATITQTTRWGQMKGMRRFKRYARTKS